MIKTQQEFQAALEKLAKAYEVSLEKINQLVEEQKQELKKFYNGQEVPLTNLFMVVKAKLDRELIRSGDPHIICVISDSGPFDYVPPEVREAYRMYKANPTEAITKGLVAGPDHALVQQGKARVGDPIGNDGLPKQVRVMRRLEVIAAPLTEDGQLSFTKAVATLWDKDAIDSSFPYFTWILVKGRISQVNTGDIFFNFSSPDFEIVKEEGMPNPYEFLIQNGLVKKVNLSELPSYYQVADKRVIPGIDVEETENPILIEANVVQMDLEKPRQVGNKQCYRMVLMDDLDPECMEKLRVNVPTHMKIEFAEYSRVAVIGRVRPVTEEYGGGWSMWQVEAIYPIPGLYFPLVNVSDTPEHLKHSQEVEAAGAIKPEITKDEQEGVSDIKSPTITIPQTQEEESPAPRQSDDKKIVW